MKTQEKIIEEVVKERLEKQNKIEWGSNGI